MAHLVREWEDFVAQFDIYENPDALSKDAFPYFLDMQHGFHEGLQTRLLVPLSTNVSGRMDGLEPIVNVKGRKLAAIVPEMVTLPMDALGKKVDNLSTYSSDLINAIDFLITGF